jgi:hypothetical protein
VSTRQEHSLRRVTRSVRHGTLPASGAIVPAAEEPRGDAIETPHEPPKKELHVYLVPLVQTFQDREVVLWNSGPIVAWEPAKALQEAVVRLMRHGDPIPVLVGGSKPRLKLQRVHATG